jgi:hypothetical protein
MALPIDQIILNNLINQLANTSNNTGQSSNATNQVTIANLLANINPRLPDVLFNNNVTATVANSGNGLANILASNANAINTANSTNQLNVLIPQITNETPAVQVVVTTNQAQLQQGQQMQIQLPDASAFTRVAANNIVANVNIVVPPSQNTEAQNINARINIIVPPISNIDSNLEHGQFIKQDINNPNALLGKNFSAYFIQTPDEGITTKLPSQLTQPINQPQEIVGLHIRINNISLPNSPQSAPAATPSNFTGTVIFAADSETIINTNIGTLRLPINLQVPVGTNIEFDIAAIDLKNFKNLPEAGINNADVLKQYLNSDNSALKQLLSALQINSAAVAGNNQAPTAQLPNTTDKYIMARALWFLGNVSGATPEKWLGDENHNNLRKAADGNNLLSRVDGLFKTLRGFFASGPEQAATQAWNNFVIPFMDSDNELNFVNFYTERDADGENTNNENKATRFIVELNNSYYGEVQIDGLLSKHPTSKTLDVFFRYSGNINDEDKNNIRDIFQNSLEQSNLKGNLIFQQTEIELIPRPYANGQVAEAISPSGYII